MTSFKRPEYAGGHRIRVTPVPIPNTEVKPDTADGTAWETVWESRSLPAVIRGPDRESGRVFFCTSAAIARVLPDARARRSRSARSGTPMIGHSTTRLARRLNRTRAQHSRGAIQTERRVAGAASVHPWRTKKLD